MSTQVQGALIIAAAVLIAGLGAAYMLSPERDVERCVEATPSVPEPTEEEWTRLKGRKSRVEQMTESGRYILPGQDPSAQLYQEEAAERRLYVEGEHPLRPVYMRCWNAVHVNR